MTTAQLPKDLLAFLEADTALQYDPGQCECGLVSLHKLHHLPTIELHVDSEGASWRDEDPHRDEPGAYIIPGLDLLASCEDYPPAGILVYVPELELYGSWDCDQYDLIVFREVDWGDITSDPLPYLNAQWNHERFGAPYNPLGRFPFRSEE